MPELQVSDIPQEWKELLSSLQTQFPRVVLAGGALRDLHHGKPVKDLDIFVECGDDEEAEGLNELLGGKKVEQPELQWYPESMREVILVSDIEEKHNPLDIPVQLIFCNWNMKDILTRFDYGICRIGFDGKEIFWDKSYEYDVNNQAMTLVRCQGEVALAASVARYARWREKYPEHQWVLGCHLEMGREPIDISF